MPNYVKTQIVVEAFTFDEFLEWARKTYPDQLTAGYVWSINFHGAHMTHETDDCYLLADAAGLSTTFSRGDIIAVEPNGQVRIYDAGVFHLTHKVA